MAEGTFRREEFNKEIDRRQFKLPLYHVISHGLIIIALIVLAIVFPQISIILFICIPILFSISNIFFDKSFRRNIIERNEE
jgi:hypothetical protein